MLDGAKGGIGTVGNPADKTIPDATKWISAYDPKRSFGRLESRRSGTPSLSRSWSLLRGGKHKTQLWGSRLEVMG